MPITPDHDPPGADRLEFTGKAGDVIFCHGWIVHSAGIHETDRIRMAAVQDFNKVRERSHMRWTAAGKNGGPRINGDMDGVFRFSGESDDDPADGHREVTNQWIDPLKLNQLVDELEVEPYHLNPYACAGNQVARSSQPKMIASPTSWMTMNGTTPR